jgi:hypothetical protein
MQHTPSEPSIKFVILIIYTYTITENKKEILRGIFIETKSKEVSEL